MRYKTLSISAILITGIGLTGLQAQNLFIKENSGTQMAYALSSIKKMSFSSGNLTVTKTDHTVGVYPLSNLRYLNFMEFPIFLDRPSLAEDQILPAYPNPVKDVLTLDFAGASGGEGTLSIINAEGRTVISRQVSHAGFLSVNISHLPEGIYICHYNNTNEVKTVKIVKR